MRGQNKWKYAIGQNQEEIWRRLKTYQLEQYQEDIKILGLSKTWEEICKYVLEYGENKEFLTIDNFARIYEMGLALLNKDQKKKRGQYYTPDDVAQVMSQWLKKLDGDKVCDVACGTGKLILTYLEQIGYIQARQLLKEEKVYLYDADEVALKICKTAILYRYGKDLEDKIHIIHGDFLKQDIVLPKNCKTIANPPYAIIEKYGEQWKETEVLKDTKELYAVFMEKIIQQSRATVIITPFSFISGNKFYSLRKVLNNYTGSIYSFDNVPGNIFLGRKQGVFNSNQSNSVRAAITVVQAGDQKGFRVTSLIRFKHSERAELLNTKTLEKFLGKTKQIVSDKTPMLYKCDPRLEKIWKKWQSAAKGHVLQELTGMNGKYKVFMPNTCRYYTTASAKPMKRRGQITISINEEDAFYYLFCFINSSFAYWFWRLYDGGITYPVGLLMKLPIFYHKLTIEDKKFFREMTEQMIKQSKNFKIMKNNMGIQENIKYPKEYRDKINRKILEILELEEDCQIFDIIHSNMALEVNLS